MSECVDFTITKDPQADLDYGFNWGPNSNSATGWLDGDTISASTWAVQSGSGLSMHDESNDTTTTTVWLSGGVVSDVAWRVTNTITTTGGRIDERSFLVTVQER